MLEAFLFGPNKFHNTDDVVDRTHDKLRLWLDRERAAFLSKIINRNNQDGRQPVQDGDINNPSHDSRDKLMKGIISNNEIGGDLYDLDDDFLPVGSGSNTGKIRRCIKLEEKFQLMFLVRSSSRALAQSLLLIEK